MVGLRYKMGQTVISGKTTVPDLGERMINITAEALPGYLLIGEAKWSRVYGRPTNLQMLSIEDFRGPAGEKLIPDDGAVDRQLRYGRELPIVGARRMRWYTGSASYNTFVLAGNNELHSDPSISIAQTVDPATDDVEVEIDVKEWAANHGSGFTVLIASGGKELYKVTLAVRGQADHITVMDIPGTRFKYGDPGLIGIWKFRRKGDDISVTLPNGDSYAYQGDKTGKVGNTVGILIPPSTNGRMRFGSIKISGVVR